jgi:hypothetical protein
VTSHPRSCSHLSSLDSHLVMSASAPPLGSQVSTLQLLSLPYLASDQGRLLPPLAAISIPPVHPFCAEALIDALRQKDPKVTAIDISWLARPKQISAIEAIKSNTKLHSLKLGWMHFDSAICEALVRLLARSSCAIARLEIDCWFERGPDRMAVALQGHTIQLESARIALKILAQRSSPMHCAGDWRWGPSLEPGHGRAGPTLWICAGVCR